MSYQAQWQATFVHGNDDVEETTEASLADALAWARGIEQRRCNPQGGYPLQSLIDTFEIRGEFGLQYGTNYHYLTIEKVQQ